MKNRLVNYILIACMTLIVAACGTLTPEKKAQIQSALSTGASVLVASAQLYQAIGEPGLPTQYKSLYNGLTSGAAQLQAQVGRPANVTVINTGTPAVNAAIVANIQPGKTVSQGDVNVVQAAATIVAGK